MTNPRCVRGPLTVLENTTFVMNRLASVTVAAYLRTKVASRNAFQNNSSNFKIKATQARQEVARCIVVIFVIIFIKEEEALISVKWISLRC